jgi:HAD superfamily phosphoserine phosphatase-like hydrolase
VSFTPGFASVVIDVDSTLCGIEGIDWLSELRGSDVGKAVADLTDQAMRGEIPLDSVYGARLDLVHPSVAEMKSLAAAYKASLAPGAAEAIAALRAADRRVVLVSGGLRDAILPVARSLGLSEGDVHAVGIRRGKTGEYAGFDEQSPLATSAGKAEVVRSLGLPRRVLAVGDGATDLAIRPVVDAFAAFTGYVRRAPVVAGADLSIASFAQLVEIVLA